MMDVIMVYLEPAFYFSVLLLILYIIPFDDEEFRSFRRNHQVYMNRPTINNFMPPMTPTPFMNHMMPQMPPMPQMPQMPYMSPMMSSTYFDSIPQSSEPYFESDEYDEPSAPPLFQSSYTQSSSHTSPLYESHDMGKKCPTCREAAGEYYAKLN